MTAPPEEPTFSARLSDEAHASPYPCLAESAEPTPIDQTRDLAQRILEQYVGTTQARSKWRKVPRFRVNWNAPRRGAPGQVAPQHSSWLTFDSFVAHLGTHRGLVHSELNLAAPEDVQRNWMDRGLTLFAHYLPMNGATSAYKVNLPLSLGAAFPVTPAIDREGFATVSPQLHLQRALLAARQRVLHEAPAFVPQVLDRELGHQAAIMLGATPPLAALMEFATLYVALFDITVIQGCYAAMYDPLGTKLSFDRAKIGGLTGRTIEDKLHWVYLLSGNRLEARDEIAAFSKMKAVRNHLTHFDPPCLVVTIDDVAEWLSAVTPLAWLLIKIRKCFGVPISGPLIQMAMAPKVIAVPRDPAHPRHPQPSDAGYASSTWKGPHPHRRSELPRVTERIAKRYSLIASRASEVLGRPVSASDVLAMVHEKSAEQLEALGDSALKQRMTEALAAKGRGPG